MNCKLKTPGKIFYLSNLRGLQQLHFTFSVHLSVHFLGTFTEKCMENLKL